MIGFDTLAKRQILVTQVMKYSYFLSKSIKYQQVLEKIQIRKEKNWGVLVKILGLKTGSHEFHALKRNHDMGEIPRKIKHQLPKKTIGLKNNIF